jgi:hypothetical protein
LLGNHINDFSGDVEKLKHFVTDGLLSKMNPEVKRNKLLGTMKWETHGFVTRPQLLHVAQAKAQVPGGEQKIVQATVKIQLKQVLKFC